MNKKVCDLVKKQLSNFWNDYDEQIIEECIDDAICRTRKSGDRVSFDRYFHYSEDGEICIESSNTVLWSVFLYYLSNSIYNEVKKKENMSDNNLEHIFRTCDYVYYLNKIMNGVELFYAIELPEHFWMNHCLGSVLGRADYGDYLMIYHKCTIGNGNGRTKGSPCLGNNVCMYEGSSILGNCKIGDNVILAAGARVVNMDIPDNCVVFGTYPNITIKRYTEKQMRELTAIHWKWDE